MGHATYWFVFIKVATNNKEELKKFEILQQHTQSKHTESGFLVNSQKEKLITFQSVFDRIGTKCFNQNFSNCDTIQVKGAFELCYNFKKKTSNYSVPTITSNWSCYPTLKFDIILIKHLKSEFIHYKVDINDIQLIEHVEYPAMPYIISNYGATCHVQNLLEIMIDCGFLDQTDLLDQLQAVYETNIQSRIKYNDGLGPGGKLHLIMYQMSDNQCDCIAYIPNEYIKIINQNDYYKKMFKTCCELFEKYARENKNNIHDFISYGEHTDIEWSEYHDRELFRYVCIVFTKEVQSKNPADWNYLKTILKIFNKRRHAMKHSALLMNLMIPKDIFNMIESFLFCHKALTYADSLNEVKNNVADIARIDRKPSAKKQRLQCRA